MSDKSAIEWTESTWNPVRGCIKVSPGCAHCYAETFAERFRGVPGHAYEQGFDLRLVPEKLDEPLRRKKPTTYFVNSMSDLFQEGVPDLYIDRVFAGMAMAPQHTFQVLTKRAERMRAYMTASDRRDRVERCTDHIDYLEKWPLPNVWLGVSVENQHFADKRIPLLLQTPAAVRFISAEPLLGPVDLRSVVNVPTHSRWQTTRLDWVIVGGESGHGARSFDLAWARSIVSQCRAAGVPVFVKQLGANAQDADGSMQGRYSAGGIRHDFPKLLDRKGGDPAEWPEDLRVRQFPARGRR